MLGAAHKPGAIPLRPLTLGDMYDGAFRIIRFNPRATVGSAVLVAAVAMAIPVLVTAVTTAFVDAAPAGSGGGLSEAEAISMLGAFGSLGLGTVLQSIGLILVSGMIAHVTAAAAVGRRLSLAEAWAATRGKRWRLVGLTFLLALMLVAMLLVYAVMWVVAVVVLPTWAVVLFGVLSVPAFLAFLVWFWVRVYYLPAPALMLEEVGVTGAIGRAFALTRRQFWRTFGIALLTYVIAQVAGSMLTLPLSIFGQLLVGGASSSEVVLMGMVLVNAIGSVVSAAFVAPFTTTVAALQYLDQRMRKEAYDVELMHRAGITAP